jgi:hypothetical protein
MSTEDPTGPEQEITPEQLAMAFAHRIGQTPVRDILLQTLASFVDVAGIRLGLGPEGEGPRDLPQARQAIEALRALVEVAERELGAAQVRPFREPLAALQMAYAQAAEAPGGSEADADPEAAAPASGRPAEEPPAGSADDPASRLWTPPGTRR